jgi:hypothetical protein
LKSSVSRSQHGATIVVTSFGDSENRDIVATKYTFLSTPSPSTVPSNPNIHFSISQCKFHAHDKCYKLITVRCGEAVAVPEGNKKPASDGNVLKHTTNKKALKEQQRKSEATAFDSSLIILGADPIALRDRVLKASPVLVFEKDEFAANHLLGAPNQKNHPMQKARVRVSSHTLLPLPSRLSHFSLLLSLLSLGHP